MPVAVGDVNPREQQSYVPRALSAEVDAELEMKVVNGNSEEVAMN